MIDSMQNGVLNLKSWRWIVINSSGGKDSQVAMDTVVRECDRQGVDRSRIVVSHQCLKTMEWEGVMELVKQQAAFYGLRFETSNYRNKHGEEITLLEYVRRRGKWPDSKNRFCTSDFKRGPGNRVIVRLSRESPGDVLSVFGFRAQESPARAKKEVFTYNHRLSTRTREVWEWLPIHDWKEQAVWERIKESGMPYHPAYALGMPRLSCVFCIFAPRAAF